MLLPKLLAVPLLLTILTAQTPPPLQEASAKPSLKNHAAGMRLQLSPQGLTAEGATLEDLIRAAYSVRDFQIAGGPAWLRSDLFDVTAKPLGGPPRNFFGKPLPVLQQLLKEKFSLRLHRETRTLPVFALTVSKTGGELHKSRVSHCPTFDFGRYSPPPGEFPKDCSAVETGPNRQLNETLNAVGMSISQLIETLSRELDRAVIDKTQLSGLFDIILEWNRTATKQRLNATISEDPDTPSLFEAVEQQLGLKLEPAKAPLEVLVIDSAAKPRS